MKLLNRYHQSTLAITAVIMLIAGVVYYFTISAVLSQQVEKALVVEEHEIRDYVALNNSLPRIFETNHQSIHFSRSSTPVKRRYQDTVYRDLKDNELEPARALYTAVMAAGQPYLVTVVQSKVETEDLIEGVLLVTLGLVVALVVALYVLNRVVLSSIWKPFYVILAQLKVFNLSDNRTLGAVSSDIEEFKELDQAVSVMAGRARNEYQTLKSFAENASHELMTPIAVINSKLDTLVQTGSFNERQSQLLDDIYTSVSRLTRLNKSLLLLTKIENGLINDEQDVDLALLISGVLTQLEEFIGSRQLTVECNIKPKVVKASLLLTEILISNLVGNAIRHNHPGGVISIRLDDDVFCVSNTGIAEHLNQAKLFRRFQKSALSEGTGLGLTISKEICEVSGFSLVYEFTNSKHEFTVSFHPVAAV